MSAVDPGIQVALAATDIEALFRWLVNQVRLLPIGTTSGIDVNADTQALSVTLRDFDVSPLAADHSSAIRLLCKAIPKMDLIIFVTAKQSGDRSLRIEWTIPTFCLGAFQRIGGGKWVMGMLTAALGEAVADTTSSAFTLHLDRLPAPMPAITQPWRLSSASIPGPPGIAAVLCATSA